MSWQDELRKGIRTAEQLAPSLGWTLEELMEKTILAMRSCEAGVNEEMAGCAP